MEEKWMYISGYGNKYAVSNLGNVMSLNYNNTHKPKLLKQKVNKKTGECEVKLSINNVAKDHMVARLVAEAFIPNPMQKPEVMHKSLDKLDNTVDNLEWAYKSETRHNMYNKGSRKIGNPSYAKITYEDKIYYRYIDIAKQKGLNATTFKNRLKRGWGLYEALEIPTGKSQL